MTSPSRTLRVVFPQWQGGDITGYALGAAVLDAALPASPHMTTVAIDAPPPADQSGLLGSPEVNGISSYDAVAHQLEAAVSAISSASPDRVLTLGGDCAVSLAPFSWLAHKYEDFGIVWLDAHPDMWAGAHQPHANARAAAILSGRDESQLSRYLPTTVPLDRFVWVGTRAEIGPELVDLNAVWRNRVRVDEVEADPSRVVAKLRRKGVRHLAIHFDLDVLDASEFHGVAVGEADGLTWAGVGALLSTLDAEFDLVGLTVAEHIPEGLEALRRIVGSTSLVAGRPPHDRASTPRRARREPVPSESISPLAD